VDPLPIQQQRVALVAAASAAQELQVYPTN
jgi:hypothetical protein